MLPNQPDAGLVQPLLSTSHTAPQARPQASQSNEISANFDTANVISGPHTRHPCQYYGNYIFQSTSEEPKQTTNLNAFHTALCTAFNMAADPTTKRIHHNTLPTEPHNWNDMLKHPHREHFMVAAGVEVQKIME